MAENKLTLNSDTEVAVRMYGQGFGDCFLIALPRQIGPNVDRANPVYIVIDSGVFYNTPGDHDRMKSVATSLQEATGRVIDLLVLTHEHHDHLCGFEYAKELWQQIQVRQIWAAWTENPKDDDAIKFNHERKKQEQKFAVAAKRLSERIGAQQLAGQPDQGLLSELRQAFALAAFGSAQDPFSEDALSEVAKVLKEGPKNFSSGVDKIFTRLITHPEQSFLNGETTTCNFCRPGDVRQVPDTTVDAFVLGPPTDPRYLSTLLIEDEVYPLRSSADAGGDGNSLQFWSRLNENIAADNAANLGFAAALERVDSAKDDFAPFRQPFSASYAQAQQEPFFKEHYFDADAGQQIEDEWLRGAGQFALQLDDLTNNTSLVLALRLPDSRVLLFVGDAMVGNWLSWELIQPADWVRKGPGGDIQNPPTIKELLGSVAVYKVGHHGSHNATLRDRGVRRMPKSVISFVPTDRNFPQATYDKAWQIPLDSLLDDLQARTGGQIVLPYDDPRIDAQFHKRIESSAGQLPAMERDVKREKTGVVDHITEGPVELWRQIRI